MTLNDIFRLTATCAPTYFTPIGVIEAMAEQSDGREALIDPPLDDQQQDGSTPPSIWYN